MQTKTAQYPHLTQLLQEIQEPVGFPTRPKTTGREEIIKALTGLNDIIRLCSLLKPAKDPLDQLEDVPCIHTPFRRSQTTQSEKLGNLVIVDTPGPNEAGENHKLAGIVKEQLEKSSMVLIVLDFTQLKTQAAEKVKEDVPQVINLRGKDNLYVLINKVDQRRDGDMSPEQVQQFVAAELGLGDAGDTSRVFEVSARRAFSAANFMQELERHPNSEVTEMQTARSLAQEVFGIDWEEELEEAKVDEVDKKAQKLWKKSGFKPFLERAINALMERAAPQCMISALSLSLGCLEKLSDDTQLRTSGIEKEATELQLQVNLLEDDLNDLESCRNHLNEVDNIKKSLQQKLNNTLINVKQDARVKIEEFSRKEGDERANLAKKTEIVVKKFFEVLQRKDYKGSDLIEFPNTQEAEAFIDLALDYAKQKIGSWLESITQQAKEDVEQSCQALLTVLQGNTEKIIERARTRLNEAFHVNLSLPPMPEWQTVHFSGATPNKMTKERTEYQREKYKPWHRLWLFEVERITSSTKTDDYYTVSVEKLIAEINQSIDTNIDNINQGINNYIDVDFQQRIDMFFGSIDIYFCDYRDSLKQAQADQQLSLDRKDELVEELSSLLLETSEQIKTANKYLERTKFLMRDK